VLIAGGGIRLALNNSAPWTTTAAAAAESVLAAAAESVLADRSATSWAMDFIAMLDERQGA
jgi:hypothetical protein